MGKKCNRWLDVPSKAEELYQLCEVLRAADVVFFPIEAGRRGEPDLVVAADTPVAVWLRRAEYSQPLTAVQDKQLLRTAARGWATLIAFGARDALRELQLRGISGQGDEYAIATARCG